jgi:hypothetical protein
MKKYSVNCHTGGGRYPDHNCHSGLDPESRIFIEMSFRRNGVTEKSFWIPASAGMTEEGGNDDNYKGVNNYG